MLYWTRLVDAFRTKLYNSVERLQDDLDAWLVQYIAERSHQVYRNKGPRPVDTMNEYLKFVPREA